MIAAEDKLWGLRQAGRRLEWYVEDFLKLANQLSWHDAALGACFQLGLDDETILCELPVCDFPLIELINQSNFEVEEMKEKFQSRRAVPSEARSVSPAHPTPGTPTYHTNVSDRLPRPKYSHILRSSTIVLSPETPAVPQSRPPASPLSSLSAISLSSAQKRRMQRKRLWTPAPEFAPLSAPAPVMAPFPTSSRERDSAPQSSPERAPVPKSSPERAPVPESSPEKAPVPAPPECPQEPVPARKPIIPPRIFFGGAIGVLP